MSEAPDDFGCSPLRCAQCGSNTSPSWHRFEYHGRLFCADCKPAELMPSNVANPASLFAAARMSDQQFEELTRLFSTSPTAQDALLTECRRARFAELCLQSELDTLRPKAPVEPAP